MSDLCIRDSIDPSMLAFHGYEFLAHSKARAERRAGEALIKLLKSGDRYMVRVVQEQRTPGGDSPNHEIELRIECEPVQYRHTQYVQMETVDIMPMARLTKTACRELWDRIKRVVRRPQ